MNSEIRKPGAARAGVTSNTLMATVVFAVLAAVTVLVWHEQVKDDRSRLLSHTEDVCYQARRRLETYLDAKLQQLEVFAIRWATHEMRDFSHRRFEEFGNLLIDETGSFHAIALLSPDGTERWVEPEWNSSIWDFLDSEGTSALEQASVDNEIVISAPVEAETGTVSVFATLPLRRQSEFLGSLVVELRADSLIDEVFGQRIRAEFGFAILDEGQTVVRHELFGSHTARQRSAITSSQRVSVGNRVWQLTVVPRRQWAEATGWLSNLLVPVFGFTLSLLLSWLVYLLLKRMQAYRESCNDALREVAERLKTERELRRSENRYRSVFESSTEGIIVMNRDGCIVGANMAVCAMHGYPRGGMDGNSVREIIADDHQHKYDELMEGIGKHGAAIVESVGVRVDGSRFEVEVRGNRFEHDGHPAVLAHITDVSERQRVARRQALLSRKVLVAQEEERARLSRDLHDGLGQSLTALRFELDWVRRQVCTSHEEADGGFTQADVLLQKAAEELRAICMGLRPPLLDDLGLESSVRQYAQDFGERTSVNVELETDFDERSAPCSSEVALVTIRVLQEALTNVRRHSDAKNVRVSLVRGNSSLELVVADDGRGFDTTDIGSSLSIGIAGMRERTNLVNGTIDISSKPFHGTVVSLRVPLNEPQRGETP